MNNERTICWGMIGCGSVTESKSAPAYQNIEGFELIAVMCRHPDKADDYAHRHNISKYYSNALDLIHDPDIDAVYIATPPDSHLEYALMVADAGKICCIEKPMAVCYDDAAKILRAFRSRKLKLFIAYYRRCLPRFLKVKEWLEDGRIGGVRHVSWSFCRPASEQEYKVYNWRTDSAIAPGGYFDDLASHGLDLIIFLLGDIENAAGFAENQGELYTAKDAIAASWVHANGVTGSGFWNFGCEKAKDRLEIFGDSGTISLSVFKDESSVLESEDLREELYIENPVPVQEPFVQMIADDLCGRTTHVSSGDSGCHTSWVMSKILEILEDEQ